MTSNTDWSGGFDRGQGEKTGCGLLYRLKELTLLSAVLSAVLFAGTENLGREYSEVERRLYADSRMYSTIDPLSDDFSNFACNISTMITPSNQCCCQSNDATKSNQDSSQRIQSSKFLQ